MTTVHRMFNKGFLVLALTTLFLLAATVVLPAHGQTRALSQADLARSEATGEAALVSWDQPGFNAAHTGYNNKEKTLSPTNVSGLTQTWLFPTNAEINVPTLTSGNTVFVDSEDNNLRPLGSQRGALCRVQRDLRPRRFLGIAALGF